MFSANLEIVSQLSKLSLPEFSGVYVSVYLKASPHEDGYDMMPLAWLHTFFLMEYMFEGCFKVKRVKRVNISVTHSLFLTHLQMSLWTYGVLQDCLTVITEDQGCKRGGGESPHKQEQQKRRTKMHMRVDIHMQEYPSHADRLTRQARNSSHFDRDNPVATREGKVRKRQTQTQKSRLEAEGTKPRRWEKEEEKQVAEHQSQANPDTRGWLCLIDWENRRGGGVDTEHKNRLWGGRRRSTGRR